MVILGSSICLGTCTLRHLGPAAHIPFDPVKWRQVELYTLDNTRYRMYPDLLMRHTLLGMSKQEILELLGSQSDPEYFRDWDLRYWLGPEPGIGVDSIWLVIKLQESRVVDYQVVTD